jgi:Protein of unknown function (DUF3300)
MTIHARSLCSQIMALTCSLLLITGSVPPPAQARSGQQAAAPDEAAPKIPNDQLDSLVAPIALYPDPLLAQVLAASTYPLEIIQLQQWLTKNKGLSDKALADAVMKEDWDPSVQAMAALPDVAKRLADDIKWTTDLGNAFLAQQADVMDAVQRMRAKAKDTGNLKPSEQQKVETKVVENKSVIVIEQANPQVVYVPTYNPTVVYGPPVYPYPPIYYPPPGYYAAGMAISFGVGVAMGAAWGGGWGYHSNWGGGNNNITINNNNSFVNNSNRQNVNNVSGNRTGGNNSWQHNAQHRGGAPYSNRATASQYGGTARGDSTSTRQANARQTQAQAGSRQQAGGTRPNQDQAGARQQSGAGNLSTGNAGANRASTGTGAANRATGSGGASAGTNRTGASGGAGGGDRVGNRSVPPSTGASSKSSALSGASGGAGGSAARTSSSRGASSMGASRSGGGGRRR